MVSHAFLTLDVFTRQRFGGNPLAVFPDARDIADADMQRLAAEFNLSESAFIQPPTDPANTARVRIFSRMAEMPFAGHPLVGVGHVLAQMGRDTDGVLRLEVPAGLTEVTITRTPDGTVDTATITAPQPLTLGIELPLTDTAACLGLTAEDIVVMAHRPVQSSLGNPFVIVEVRPDALARAVPDPVQFRAVLAQYRLLGSRLAMYVYTQDAGTIRARMFAPLSGTVEDAATGSACATLAALLLMLARGESARYDVIQGVEMGRPSLLHASARRMPDRCVYGSVGGGCVPVLRGEALL